MKRFAHTLLGLALLAPLFATAAEKITKPRIYVSPAFYRVDEEMTWYFDFSESPEIEPADKLYLWTWNPGIYKPEGATDNTPCPLKHEEKMLWSLTLTPTKFYNMSVEDVMKGPEINFWFNIRKDPDATKETGTLSIPKDGGIAAFKESGKTMDYSPVDFKLGEPLTIIFNANKVDGFLPAPSTVNLHGGMNDWTFQQQFNADKPEIREKTIFEDLGDGIYRKTLVPLTYFPGVDEDTEMENINLVIAKYDGANGWAGAAPDMKIIAPGVPVPPPANFYLFPLKVSVNDILIITRDNNDKRQTLSYTLTGGGKTLSGAMIGNRSQQRIFIDLGKEFASTGAASLDLRVTDNHGSTIYEGKIPLVTLDKPSK